MPDLPSAPPPRTPPAARRFLTRALPLLAVAALTSGCGIPTFGFPTLLATEQSARTLSIWQGSVIAALAVGAFVAALIIWAPIRYRRRGDELPKQVRYNLPIEVLYTMVPFVIIAVLFFYTLRDESYLNRLTPEDEFKARGGVEVGVIGFQWNWKFEYPQYDASTVGTTDQAAVLYLPAGRPVRFVEQSRDVIHSFWIIEFAMKRDVVPGRINTFEVTPDRVGTYRGRCAELCGYQHDRMNFTVKVLPSAEFDATMRQVSATSGLTSDGGQRAPYGNTSNADNGVGNREPETGGDGLVQSDRPRETQGEPAP